MTNEKIPLAERMRGKAGGRKLPTAMGLYVVDFFDSVGAITGMQQRYSDIYDTYIKSYDDSEDTTKSVQELVVAAYELLPSERNVLLFRLLVEPFAAIDTTERGEQL